MARKGEDCRASVERSIFAAVFVDGYALSTNFTSVFRFVQRNIVSGPCADLSTGDKNMVVVMCELFFLVLVDVDVVFVFLFDKKGCKK